MLSSITPLGQRSRGGSWARTVTAFAVGAVLSGVTMFGMAGAVGEWAGLSSTPSAWVSILVLGVAAILDLARVRPPGPRRQVDEDWLGRYRDWVTGLGFGAQLGAGLTTIVPTFAVWALIALSLLNGLPLALLVGISFGVGRWLLLLSTRNVVAPGGLARLMGRFTSFERVAGRALYASYGMVIVLVTLIAL